MTKQQTIARLCRHSRKFPCGLCKTQRQSIEDVAGARMGEHEFALRFLVRRRRRASKLFS
jgi:hypothetical protein